jgi:beta-glucosidase
LNRGEGIVRVLWLAVLLLSLVSAGTTPLLSQKSGSTGSIEIEARIETILSRLTLEQKMDLIGGVDGFYIRAIPEWGVPRLRMADGPLGVRNFGPATAMAGGIALAATWNPALAERVGIEIGRDARAKGVHFLLGPGANIYRAPMNGRNFEYLGEDPFLASSIVVGYIKGVQSQGVSATIKHFMGNNSEFDRHNIDDVIDERTLREIYLPVFEAAVKQAHVGAIMTSYNLTNGVHMSQNGALNTDVVKKEWGFDGLIMSDWGSTYDAVGAANGGLDLEMPSGAFMNRKDLMPAVELGKVTTATIDDKVRRILRTAARFGWLDRDQTEISIPRYNQKGRQAALQAARESMVLLKNERNLLPLDKAKTKSLAVIGPNAYPAVPVGGGSARVEAFAPVSFLEGISNYLQSANVYYRPGLPSLREIADATLFSTAPEGGQPGLRMELFDNIGLTGKPVLVRIDRRITADFGPQSAPLYSARWTGYYNPKRDGTYELFAQIPGEGIGYRVYLDDRLLIDAWRFSPALVNQATVSLSAAPHRFVFEMARRRMGFGGGQYRVGIAQQANLVDPYAKALAQQSDAVVVAVGYDPETESEGGDRTFGLPFGQDRLIQEIAAANQNTIVVITSGGGVDMNSWLDRVPALIEAWYPGQEGGTALAEIIFGDTNPSGRLPVTFEQRWEDSPVRDSYYPEPGTRRVVYKEGVFLGYRGYERNKTKPLFPFGYGLSYTGFKYGNLGIKEVSPGAKYEISFDLINTGSRAGSEVSQVYVGDSHSKVPRPAKELKGLAKTELRPGETERVTVTLDGRAFSYYDAEARQWRAEPGKFSIFVGHSSGQIDLQGDIWLREP